MNLCKDCKHYRSHELLERCHHPSFGVSPVDGKVVSRWCSSMRGSLGLCGPRGELFEERESDPILPYLPWYVRLWQWIRRALR